MQARFTGVRVEGRDLVAVRLRVPVGSPRGPLPRRYRRSGPVSDPRPTARFRCGPAGWYRVAPTSIAIPWASRSPSRDVTPLTHTMPRPRERRTRPFIVTFGTTGADSTAGATTGAASVCGFGGWRRRASSISRSWGVVKSLPRSWACATAAHAARAKGPVNRVHALPRCARIVRFTLRPDTTRFPTT